MEISIGLASNTNASSIYVTGVEGWIITIKDYALWIRSKGALTKENKQYNHTLRAPPYRPQKFVVFVPGFYERGDNPRTNSGGTKDDQVTPKSSSPHPSTEMNPVLEMDTHEEFINADVIPDVPHSRTDRDLVHEP